MCGKTVGRCDFDIEVVPDGVPQRFSQWHHPCIVPVMKLVLVRRLIMHQTRYKMPQGNELCEFDQKSLRIVCVQ